jgi:hypothetical protein
VYGHTHRYSEVRHRRPLGAAVSAGYLALRAEQCFQRAAGQQGLDILPTAGWLRLRMQVRHRAIANVIREL